MRFFIDTAEVNEIKVLHDLGMVDGVTTNPSLIAKSGRPIKEVLLEICSFIEGPISAEVTATSYEDMMKEGLFLAKIAKNIAVKVPLTPDGLKACKTLRAQDIMVNVTLCFSAAQALLAAKAHATFISPFMGRLDDIGHQGVNLIQEIRLIYDQYPEFETQILAASVRTPTHVVDVAKLGADVVTLPPKVLHQMYKHPLTDQGLDAFLRDWKATGQSIMTA